MDYGIITFRSHPCDKNLDEEFYQMITPILNKADKFVVACESPLTPEQHYHIFISFKGDVTHLKQKFKSKSFTNWIEKTKSTMTTISTKFDDKALQIKKVAKTEEDHLKTLGYVSKENVVKSKGFTANQITEAVKYYHTCERKKPKTKDGFKVLNVKTVIPYMEQVAEKYEIPPYHKHIFYYMAKEKMMIDMSVKTKDNVRTTLRIHYEKHDLYQKDTWASELNGVNEDGESVYALKERIQELKKLLNENNIDYI